MFLRNFRTHLQKKRCHNTDYSGTHIFVPVRLPPQYFLKQQAGFRAVCISIMPLGAFCIFLFSTTSIRSRSVSQLSSVSTASDYRLDKRDSIPDNGKGSSSLCVQTTSKAHPASHPKGTGGPFPGSKAWPGRDTDNSHLSTVGFILLSPLTPEWPNVIALLCHKY
jgi:hypothetical protein